MKLRKLASVVAVATALIVGGAPIAAAVEGYQLVPGAGASAEEVHEAIVNLPQVVAAPGAPVTVTLPGGTLVIKSTPALPTIVGGAPVIQAPAAIAATVATWGVTTPATVTAVVNAVAAGAQAHHINTPVTAFTGVYMTNAAGILTPLTSGTFPNTLGGFGDATTGDFHTMSGSTIIVLNRSFLESLPTGQHVQLTAVFDGLEIESHAVQIHAVGIDATTAPTTPTHPGTPTTPGQPAAPRPVHPATGPATLLYAVGGLLLAGGGAALVNSAKRRKAENV